jgi:hypothetical protein
METQQILEMLKAMQEKADADRKEDHEALDEMNATMKSNLKKAEASMKANQDLL